MWPVRKLAWESTVLTALFATLLFIPSVAPTPEVSRLDNGLQVVMVPDSREALVSVQLWLRAGSADDEAKYPGLCAAIRGMLEHGLDVPERLRAAEVRFESRTLRDACYFAWFVPPERLDDALQIEARRLQCSPGGAALTTAAGGDEPLRRLLAAAFAGHPYQSPPGLVGEALKDLPPDEVQDFQRRWFVPGNATLLVIGDVQTPAVLEAVRRHFGGVPWAEPPRRAPGPLAAAERVKLPPMPADQGGLDVAWVTSGAGSADSLALAVLMQRLCNPVDGPLYRRLVEACLLPPRWSQDSGRAAGMVVLSVDVAEEAPRGSEEIEGIIAEELERAAQALPMEIELNRARALAARAVRLRQTSFADRALNLGFYEVVVGDMLLADWELPRLARLTVGDLQRVAAQLREARTVYLPRTRRTGETPPATPVRTADPTRVGTPQAVCDGVSVAVCTQPAAALAEVRTIVTGEADVADALDALMAVGSTRHSVEPIRDYLTYHGLDLFPLAAGPQHGLISRGPATHVAQMIELHGELLRYPSGEVGAGEPGRRLRRWLQEERSAEHEWYVPPGFIGWRAGAIPPTDPAAVRRALDALQMVRSIEVIVTGNVDAPTVHDAVRAAWEGWRPPAPPSR
jgi:zinc protease